jgi:hypothetical protein
MGAAVRSASIGLVLMLVGCGQFTEADIEIDTARPDMPDTADTDAQGGALTVSYTLVGYNGTADCAAAGVSLVHLVASGPGEPIEVDYPCDDEAIRLADVAAGAWTVELRAEIRDAEGPFYAGEGSVEIEGESVLDVTLECDDNGWDDGCGGA